MRGGRPFPLLGMPTRKSMRHRGFSLRLSQGRAQHMLKDQNKPCPSNHTATPVVVVLPAFSAAAAPLGRLSRGPFYCTPLLLPLPLFLFTPSWRGAKETGNRPPRPLLGRIFFFFDLPPRPFPSHISFELCLPPDGSSPSAPQGEGHKCHGAIYSVGPGK